MRLIRCEDKERIRKIERRCFPYDALCCLDECLWWIYYDGDKDIGFCGMYYMKIGKKKIAVFYRAGIIKSYRGQGLHKKMIHARIKQAKNDDVEEIRTYTSRENIISANNLIKLGFVLYEPRWEWGLKYSFYFKKELKNG